jgi:hypothetical protein
MMVDFVQHFRNALNAQHFRNALNAAYQSLSYYTLSTFVSYLLPAACL